MRKIVILIVFSAIMAPLSRTGADFFEAHLLTQEDLNIESRQREAGNSALSSAIDDEESWESYNQWLCFRSDFVTPICSEIDLLGVRKIPTLVAQTPGHQFEFDVPHEVNWDCDSILREWDSLIQGSGSVCVFAAHLQEIDERSSLWIVDQIKTEGGYWHGSTDGGGTEDHEELEGE